MPTSNAESFTLKSVIGGLNAQRERYGTLRRSDFEIHVMDVTASTADDFRRLEDLGATDIVTGFASEGQDTTRQTCSIGRSCCLRRPR